MEEFAIIRRYTAKCRLAEPKSLIQHCVEHRCEVAGRRIDDLQHLGGRGLPLTRFGKFSLTLSKLSLTLGKLTFEIGDPLRGIGYRVVGRRAHLRTSSGPIFRADHTVIGPVFAGFAVATENRI